MILRAYSVLIIAGFIHLSGCTSGPAPREVFYRLDPGTGPAVDSDANCGTILVSRMAARGFAGGRPIVFRGQADPLQVQRYNYHSWSEPPAMMIQDGIAKSLRAAGLVRFVITPTERATANWIVSGTLLRMEHFPETSPSAVEIEMEIGVVSTATRETVFLDRYLERVSAQSNRIDAAVSAFNTALQKILLKFPEDLGAAVGHRFDTCSD